MYKKFVAIAPKGQEYIYKRSSMIGAPAASAQRIADALNANNYQLQPGFIWHIYDNDFITNDYIFRTASIYKNKLRIRGLNRL